MSIKGCNKLIESREYNMINRIKDWKVPIAQLLIPLFIIPIVLVIDVPQVIINNLNKTNVKVTELEWYWRLILFLGNWPFIIVVLFFIYLWIRKYNKKNEVLKQNLSVIVWHSYFGYWICRYLLNYQVVSLTRVPIPVQFNLVWRGIFKKYEYMDGVDEMGRGEDTINVRVINSESKSPSINLLLIDTYSLDSDSIIDLSKSRLRTIVIERVSEKGVRYYSHDFVAKISNIIHSLPQSIDEVNIFATVNSAHVYNIVNNVFKTGGRDGIKVVRVYEQTKGTWNFDGRNIEIRIGG